MRRLSMLTGSLCLLSAGLIAGAAIAQNLVTGYVTNSYLDGSRFAVELDQNNTCGSSKFVSLEGSENITAVQEAVAGAADIEGVVSILTGPCVSGGAEIKGITYGPDL